MDVKFATEQLGLIETARAGETQLPFSVIATARDRLAVLRAAPDFATLMRWKSFGLTPTATCPSRQIIPIAERWGMDISFLSENEHLSIINAVEEQ